MKLENQTKDNAYSLPRMATIKILSQESGIPYSAIRRWIMSG